MGGRTVDPPDGTEIIGHVSPIHPVWAEADQVIDTSAYFFPKKVRTCVTVAEK